MIHNIIVLHGQNQNVSDRASLGVSPITINATSAETITDITVTVGYEEQTWDYAVSYEIWALPWIMVTGASKEGNDICVITVLENLGAARVGYVTFTSDYCSNKVITITQSAP